MGRRGVAIILGVGVASALLAGGPAAAQTGPTKFGADPPASRPVTLTRAPVAAQDPTPGWPLPTDGLMAPPAPVPPRSAYQNPRPAPQFTVPENIPDFTLPPGAQIPLPDALARRFRFNPRYNGRPIQVKQEMLPDGSGTRRILLVGGVIVNIVYQKDGLPKPGEDPVQEIEFAADNVVVWYTGKDAGKAADATAGGAAGGPDVFENDPANRTGIELYLSGSVTIRTRGKPPPPGQKGKFTLRSPTAQVTSSNIGAGPESDIQVTQTLRGKEIYYDVERSRAIAVAADLEFTTGALPEGGHLKGTEIWRLGPNEWRIFRADLYSSKLPSDPGMKLSSREFTMTDERKELTNFLGIPYRNALTFERVVGTERTITGRHVFVELGGVPVFYLPYLRTDADEPLGPFRGISFGMDRIFGTQLYTTWDLYRLLALKAPPGHRWKLHLDYLSDRGPAGGTDYDYSLQPPGPGQFSPGNGSIRLYGISDKGVDVLGGARGPEPLEPPPGARGRFTWRHLQTLGDDFLYQGQFSALSDKNFLEQYYKTEFDMGPNQETFAYLTWQRQNFWAGGLAEGRVFRNWVTETNSLPRVDGAVVGQDLFGLFSYNARANAGNYQLMPASISPFPVLNTDALRTNTARFDLNQDLSLPFGLGPFQVVPYGVLDLTQYTEDLTDQSRGRVYGGGGARVALPFSKLYPDTYSELFNLRGLYHKTVLSANYYSARSNTRYTNLPQLDRIYDDNTDFTVRNIVPFQSQLVPGPNGLRLGGLGDPNNIFNPQRYAIRRLVDNRIDTLDDIDVLQLDARQRFQTKRGYPGLEHVVDFLTVDLSGSYFPNPDRDNFGKPWAFLEYGVVWNAGDRVSVMSNGQYDPFDGGIRYYTVGASLDRPDRTSLYVGYRQTDPVRSKQVTVALNYQLSRRYFAGVSSSYDFGIQASLSNSLTFTRTGTDLTVMFGVTYNSLVNNFGAQFLVIPNLVALAAPGRFAAAALTNNR